MVHPHTSTAGLALVGSSQRFALSEALLVELRATRPFCDYEDRVSWEHDAFLLWRAPDLSGYLSADGRLLWLTAQELVPDAALVYASLAAGARATGVHALRALLPERSARALDCTHCGGSGFAELPPDAASTTPACVCAHCAGLGFTAPEIALKPDALR